MRYATVPDQTTYRLLYCRGNNFVFRYIILMVVIDVTMRQVMLLYIYMMRKTVMLNNNVLSRNNR